MKFGLDLFPDAWPQQKSAEQYFKEALDLCEQADRLGFHGVKIVEHYFHPYGGYSPNPIVFLVAAGQRAPRMRLMTGAVLPAFNHPLKLAGELGMLDAISGGRLELGFARAFLPYEFSAFNISMNESRARFNEGVEAVIRLLSEERVTFKGPFHSFENIESLPHPVQKPHPPIYIATIMTPESFIYTGEKGFNLMIVPYLGDFDHIAGNIELYRKSYRENGHGEVKGSQIVAVQHMYVSEDGDTARREAEPHINQYMETFIDASGVWNTTDSKDYKGYNDIQQVLKAMTFDRVINENRALIGNPSEIIEKIHYLKQKFGTEYLSLQCNFGMMPYDKALRSMQLFAEKVMPAFA